MIKYLYSAADDKRLSDGLKLDIVICVVMMVVALTVGITTCNFVTDDNATLLKIINIVVSSVCLCTAVYFILNGIVPKTARRNYIEKMLFSTPISMRGKVIGEGKKITATKQIELIELRILDEEEKEFVLYWDLKKDKPDFIGHVVEFCVVNNRIMGYGDADEASD